MKRLGLFLLSFFLLSCGNDAPSASSSQTEATSEDSSVSSPKETYFAAFDPETDFYRVKLNYTLRTPQKETVRSGTFTKQFYHGVDESGRDILIEQTTLYAVSAASLEENDDKVETRETTYRTPTKTYSLQESGAYAIKSEENDLSPFRLGFPFSLIENISEQEKGYDTVATGTVPLQSAEAFLAPCFSPSSLQGDIGVTATFKSDSGTLTELSLSYQDGPFEATLRYQYSVVNALIELPQ